MRAVWLDRRRSPMLDSDETTWIMMPSWNDRWRNIAEATVIGSNFQ